MCPYLVEALRGYAAGEVGVELDLRKCLCEGGADI